MGNNVETKCPAKEMLHTHSFIAQPIKLTPRNCRKYIKPEDRRKDFVKLLGPKPRKNSGSHIDASHSRQPLVKGERLVRNEVNAVMSYRSSSFDPYCIYKYFGIYSWSVRGNYLIDCMPIYLNGMIMHWLAYWAEARIKIARMTYQT